MCVENFNFIICENSEKEGLKYIWIASLKNRSYYTFVKDDFFVEILFLDKISHISSSLNAVKSSTEIPVKWCNNTCSKHTLFYHLKIQQFFIMSFL